MKNKAFSLLEICVVISIISILSISILPNFFKKSTDISANHMKEEIKILFKTLSGKAINESTEFKINFDFDENLINVYDTKNTSTLSDDKLIYNFECSKNLSYLLSSSSNERSITHTGNISKGISIFLKSNDKFYYRIAIDQISGIKVLAVNTYKASENINENNYLNTYYWYKDEYWQKEK